MRAMRCVSPLPQWRGHDLVPTRGLQRPQWHSDAVKRGMVEVLAASRKGHILVKSEQHSIQSIVCALAVPETNL
jgi:hypothetical protein